MILALCAAGMAGGVINAVAGGATLLTFPVMLAAELPPVTANASNAVAIAPGHLLAALADREKLPPWDRALALALGPTAAVSRGPPRPRADAPAQSPRHWRRSP